MADIENLIVGAGPAGLAMAACFADLGINYQIWEASDRVGHSWSRHYHRLHLHTVKEYSSLPLKDFPRDYPRFVSRQQMLQYLGNYAEKFNIKPQFGRKLIGVKSSGGEWLVTDNQGNETRTHNLVIATGLNRIPRQPKWPGMDSFTGNIIHSRQYRNADPFVNKKCLVVGFGNTGAEIALDLAENHIETAISVRSAVNIVPREAFGRPTQLTALKIRNFPLWFQDILGNFMKRVTIGNLQDYGIRITPDSPLQQLRTTGKTPMIDLGTVKLIREGRISVFPDISGFSGKEVTFSDGSSEEFDQVICATGYRSGISELIPETGEFLDRYGNPKFPVGSGKWAGLYFLGFDNFRPGGILGIIREDAKRIAHHIRNYRTSLNQLI